MGKTRTKMEGDVGWCVAPLFVAFVGLALVVAVVAGCSQVVGVVPGTAVCYGCDVVYFGGVLGAVWALNLTLV